MKKEPIEGELYVATIHEDTDTAEHTRRTVVQWSGTAWRSIKPGFNVIFDGRTKFRRIALKDAPLEWQVRLLLEAGDGMAERAGKVWKYQWATMTRGMRRGR